MDQLSAVKLPDSARLPKEVMAHWTTGLEKFRHENCRAEELAAPDNVTLYVTTNETWEQSLMNAIEAHDHEVDGEIFFCIGGLSSFYLFLLTKATHWINVDPCPGQAQLVELFCETIIKSSNPAEFIESFFASYRKIDFKQCDTDLELELITLYLFFLEDKSPFSIPGGFERLKQCAEEGNIQSFCIDLNNPIKAQALKKELALRGLSARCVYASNLNADHWHDVVDPKALIHSMNALTDDKRTHNVHFLYCAPTKFETCTCKRKSLIRTTAPLLQSFKGRTCKKGKNHLLVLLKRLRADFVMAYVSRFSPYCQVSIDRFNSFYLKFPTERASFHLFKEALYGLAKTKKELKEAVETFDILFDHKLGELGVEGLKENTFLMGLKWSLPKLAGKFKEASPDLQSFMPESVFIIMQAFDIILNALNKNIDS